MFPRLYSLYRMKFSVAIMSLLISTVFAGVFSKYRIFYLYDDLYGLLYKPLAKVIGNGELWPQYFENSKPIFTKLQA